MRKSVFPSFSKFLFVIGFSLAFFLAFPGTKGIILSLLSLVIGVFVFLFPRKYENKTDNYHTPLLFDFLMIAAFTVAFFSKGVPGKIIPVFICWQLGFILNVIYWLIDKQYEGKDVKQLISSNLRLPLIVDFLIIVINVGGLVTGDINVNKVFPCLFFVFAIIDVCRQLIMVKKRGKFEINDLF